MTSNMVLDIQDIFHPIGLLNGEITETRSINTYI